MGLMSGHRHGMGRPWIRRTWPVDPGGGAGGPGNPPKVDAGKDRDWNGEKPTRGRPTPAANRPWRPPGIPAHLPATDKTAPPPDPQQKVPSGRSR